MENPLQTIRKTMSYDKVAQITGLSRSTIFILKGLTPEQIKARVMLSTYLTLKDKLNIDLGDYAQTQSQLEDPVYDDNNKE